MQPEEIFLVLGQGGELGRRREKTAVSYNPQFSFNFEEAGSVPLRVC